MDEQNRNTNPVQAEEETETEEYRSLYAEDNVNPDEELPEEEEVEPIKEKPAKPVLTPEERKKKVLKEIREWVVSIVVAIIAVLLLRNYGVYPITVDGSSMNSTLLNKDRLIVTAYDVNIVNKLEKGDVVICHYPGRTSKHPILKFLTVKTDFVKRIVGVAGDTVKRVNGVTYINDTALDPSKRQSYTATYRKEADGTLRYYINGTELTRVVGDDGSVRYSIPGGYSISESALSTRYDFDYEYVLGEDEYFVVGDNRYNSHDCRAWNGPDLYYNQTYSVSGDVGPITKDMIVGRVRYVFWPTSRWMSVENNPDYIDPRDAK